MGAPITVSVIQYVAGLEYKNSLTLQSVSDKVTKEKQSRFDIGIRPHPAASLLFAVNKTSEPGKSAQREPNSKGGGFRRGGFDVGETVLWRFYADTR